MRRIEQRNELLRGGGWLCGIGHLLLVLYAGAGIYRGNFKGRTSNIEDRTSNTQHPTPNIQHPMPDGFAGTHACDRDRPLDVRCWMFGVGCSIFSFPLCTSPTSPGPPSPRSPRTPPSSFPWPPSSSTAGTCRCSPTACCSARWSAAPPSRSANACSWRRCRGWAIPHHHLDFPGTLSAAPRVYLDLLDDLVENFLTHGFRRIVFLNGHGGNIVPGQQAVFETAPAPPAARRPAAALRHLLDARQPAVGSRPVARADARWATPASGRPR